VSIIRIPGQPQQSTLSPKDWKRAWVRTYDVGPARTTRDARIVEAQIYGSVEWHAGTREGWAADPAAFWVVEPERDAAEAHRAAAANAQQRIRDIHGMRVSLLPSSLFAGFGALVATAFASPVIPYDVYVGALAVAGAAYVPEVLNRRQRVSATRLTIQQIGGHRAAFALTSIAARAAEDYDIAVMVTDTVRDVLWAAKKAGPKATGERLAQIFAALPARPATRSWIDEHPGPRAIAKPDEDHEVIDARVAATTQWLTEESEARRAVDPFANPDLPHTTQP
jgi:hypothetical protein